MSFFSRIRPAATVPAQREPLREGSYDGEGVSPAPWEPETVTTGLTSQVLRMMERFVPVDTVSVQTHIDWGPALESVRQRDGSWLHSIVWRSFRDIEEEAIKARMLQRG